MASLVEVEYGKCPWGHRYENREVEIRMTVFGRAIVLPGVPQGACPNCGSRVYKAQVLECLECLMRDGLSPESSPPQSEQK